MGFVSLHGAALLVAFALMQGCGGLGSLGTYYETEKLAFGSHFLGVESIAFDRAGRLHVMSVGDQAIYRITLKNLAVKRVALSEPGLGGDFAFGPGDQLFWTSSAAGMVYKQEGGENKVIARNLPGVDAIAISQAGEAGAVGPAGARGKVYVAQRGEIDALLEIDPTGKKPPRKIISDLGQIAGLASAPDGKLYASLSLEGKVVRIDPATGWVDILSDAVETPGEMALDMRGKLLVADLTDGEVYRIDPSPARAIGKPNGEEKNGGQADGAGAVPTATAVVLASVGEGIGAMAMNKRGELFITHTPTNALYMLADGGQSLKAIFVGELAMPGGIDVATETSLEPQVDEETGEETLVETQRDMVYVAGYFALRKVNAGTGEITTLARSVLGSLLDRPTNVKVGPKHIITSSWVTGSVQVINRESGEIMATHQGFKQPHDVIELPDGSLLVAERKAGRLTRVKADQSKQVLVSGLSAPMGIAVLGRIAFVTESGTADVNGVKDDGAVSAIDIITGKRKVIARGLTGPEGIDTDRTGKLIVAEVGKQRVVRIDPATGEINALAGGLDIGARPIKLSGAKNKDWPFTYLPTGVAVGREGVIYVSCDGGNGIYMLRETSRLQMNKATSMPYDY